MLSVVFAKSIMINSNKVFVCFFVVVFLSCLDVFFGWKSNQSFILNPDKRLLSSVEQNLSLEITTAPSLLLFSLLVAFLIR